MTNAERYLPELLHDAYCADNEGGSALYQVLPEQLRNFFLESMILNIMMKISN